MEKNTISLSYLPTANFYYFKSDKFYLPLANALFAANLTSQISSLLIVSKKSGITSLDQLKNKSLGYIHPYCTSSYFAPAILLWKNHYSIHNFFSKLQQVGAWQLQIDAVIAGKVDATTVQEDVWYHLPKNAQETQIIAKEDYLPSPLVIGKKDLNDRFKKELMELLLTHKSEPTENALFNGFIPFQKNEVESFYSNAEKAFALPTIK